MGYPTFDYPEEATLIPLSELNIGSRRRDDFGDLQGLADSIANVGLIHPPTLTRTDNTLLAGERRTKAMQMLGCTHIPVIYREDMDQDKLKEIELHENTKRLGMKWQEKTLLIWDTHQFKVKLGRKMGNKWFQSETGELLGVTQVHVSHSLLVAKAIVDGDEEVTKAPTFKDAMQVLLKRKTAEAIVEKAKRTGTIAPTAAPIITPKRRTADGEIVLGDFTSEDLATSDRSATSGALDKAVAEFDLGNFYHGDCLEVMSTLPDGCVDHVVTDIPYGIDMANLDTNVDIKNVVATHDVEQNISMFKPFLEQSYRLIRNGYCVFWYDEVHRETLAKIAESVGFKVQRWSLVWVKTHTCRNSAAQFNFTKATEVAMVLRKGDATMVKPATKNWVMADGSIERKMYDHPFIKPFEAWDLILEHIAYQGQKVLDPFAGQMSGPRAFINKGLIPYAIELEPLHFIKGVDYIVNLVNEITSNRVTFTNDPRSAVAKLIQQDYNKTLDEEGVPEF